MSKVNKAISNRMFTQRIEECITYTNIQIKKKVEHRAVFELSKKINLSKGLEKKKLLSQVNGLKEKIIKQREDVVKEASLKFNVSEMKINQIILSQYESVEEFI